jgi:hypothetical protein
MLLDPRAPEVVGLAAEPIILHLLPCFLCVLCVLGVEGFQLSAFGGARTTQ